MKVKIQCEVCKRRAKREPLKEGLSLCLLHYRMKKEAEIEKRIINPMR